MTQSQGELRVSTRGKGLHEITRDVRKWVAAQQIQSGLLTVFIRHTSASLLIQENADPDVRRDLTEFFERLVPENTPWSVTPPKAVTTCPLTFARRSPPHNSQFRYATGNSPSVPGKAFTSSSIDRTPSFDTF
jgi:hypothetical protein